METTDDLKNGGVFFQQCVKFSELIVNSRVSEAWNEDKTVYCERYWKYLVVGTTTFDVTLALWALKSVQLVLLRLSSRWDRHRILWALLEAHLWHWISVEIPMMPAVLDMNSWTSLHCTAYLWRMFWTVSSVEFDNWKRLLQDSSEAYKPTLFITGGKYTLAIKICIMRSQ